MNSNNKQKILKKHYPIISKRLNETCKYLSYWCNINNGGCCYIAYCIARLLEKENIPFIVKVNGVPKTNKLRELKHNGNHYYICIGRNDINKLKWLRKRVVIYNSTSSRMLLYHYNKHLWNEEYNYHYNYIVQKILNFTFYDCIREIQR